MRKITCKDCNNENCFIQLHCSAEWNDTIDLKKSQVHYKKGQHIIIEGTPVMGLYFICTGKVKVITAGLDGKEQIVRLAAEGHILGHRGYGDEKYPIGAVALNDSLVCFIDNTTVYDALMNNNEFMFNLMMFYSMELRKVENRLKYLSQMTVMEKVAESFVYMIDTFGINSDTKELTVILSRSEIADLAGTNADQVSRAITELKKEKIIGSNRKAIIILNEEKLRKLLDSYNVGHF